MEMTINVQMEDKYRITVSVDGFIVLVENLSVPNSCAIYIYKLEGAEERTIKEAYDKQDWEKFICEVISHGYLD